MSSQHGDTKTPSGAMEPKKPIKLGTTAGVYIPVCLNILSILMFLRFGVIVGKVGFAGFAGLLVAAYCVDLLTILSLSAIASNGEVKGGGAYYLISRSLGPEFGGSIGILFYLAQVLNTAMNVVGLIDCIRLFVGPDFPQGYWTGYGLQTIALILCTSTCLLGSATFAKASTASLVIISIAVVSIPISAIFRSPFRDDALGVDFTGISIDTLRENILPHTNGWSYRGFNTFRELFGILFPATSGIFAGASMSGDLISPSRSIPKGTLWAMLTTFTVYFFIALSLASSIAHSTLIRVDGLISTTSLWSPIILAGECAVTIFSAVIGILGSSRLFHALAKDQLLPGLAMFGVGSRRKGEHLETIVLTYFIAQIALLADLNQIATFISMGYQMTFFVMNLACFLLKIGSAPNFRPGFKFFSWQTAFLGSLLSAIAMFIIEETYAGVAICVLVFIFLLIHYLCPPKRWGDVSQNLIYHQVRKYLLRLRPEHIKFWRPHIILLINNPRRQTRLIQFCNSMKKGSLYILGHVIVTDDFGAGVDEARLQQQAWTNYISEFSRIKAFVQLQMSPSITWGIRNLILSAGLGGMRPNIGVMGFYNMDELRKSNSGYIIPDIPTSPAKMGKRAPASAGKAPRRRGDTSARLLEGYLPTDVIRTEAMMSPNEYMTMLEDLALRYRLNVAVGYGFESLETPRKDGNNSKSYIDLWPIQMSAEVSADGKSILTTNFDTYTLILQLGHILHSVQTWRRAYNLRVMVFVEYESEVEEETARVQALLEKLRIDAEIKVFWLAAGHLNTYELIINGNSRDLDWDIIVNEALKHEEWWDDLQMFRGRPEEMSSSQEIKHLTHILDSTVGRPGAYNPHGDTSSETRRPSMADASEMTKKPALAILAKMGVNMGIHTHHLQDEVLQESSSSDEDVHSDEEEMFSDDDFEYALEQTISAEGQASDSLLRRPLLATALQQRRRESQAKLGSSSSSFKSDRGRRSGEEITSEPAPPTYGTMSTAATLADESKQPPPSASNDLEPPIVTRSSPEPRSRETSRDHRRVLSADVFPSYQEVGQASSASLVRARSQSPDKPRRGTRTPKDGTMTPTRPVMSRQSSAARFSSRPVPETQITTEGEALTIGFAQEARVAERPTISGQSSAGMLSARHTPGTQTTTGEESTKTITFADQPVYYSPSAPHSQLPSRHHSRQGSQYSTLSQGDVSLSIPELVESYRSGLDSGTVTEGGTAYATQNLSLSFNDLPSRAQHLILNELMQKNSGETAVLLSTLPMPAEGTSADDSATIQYLSDVELLCNDLPPVLMVLSNNMTVTVSI